MALYLDKEGLSKVINNISDLIDRKIDENNKSDNTEIINEITRIISFGKTPWFILNNKKLILNPFNTDNMNDSLFILLFNAMKSIDSYALEYSGIFGEYTFIVEMFYTLEVYNDYNKIIFKIYNNIETVFSITSKDLSNINTRQGYFNSTEIFPNTQIELNYIQSGGA